MRKTEKQRKASEGHRSGKILTHMIKGPLRVKETSIPLST